MTKINIPEDDVSILKRLSENDFTGWQILIDKYGPMMYGCIYRLTENIELSSEILEHVFKKLNNIELIKQVRVSPAIYLFHFTQVTAFRYLNMIDFKPVNEHVDKYINFPLLKLLFCDDLTIKKAAEKLNIEITRIGIMLREESNRLRLTTAFKKLNL